MGALILDAGVLIGLLDTAGIRIAVLALTDTIAERAAELRATHDRLQLPDPLVLTTAHHHAALLT